MATWMQVTFALCSRCYQHNCTCSPGNGPDGPKPCTTATTAKDSGPPPSFKDIELVWNPPALDEDISGHMDSPSHNAERDTPESPGSPETVISMMLDQHGASKVLNLRPSSRLPERSGQVSTTPEGIPEFKVSASVLLDSATASLDPEPPQKEQKSPFKELEDENARSGFTTRRGTKRTRQSPKRKPKGQSKKKKPKVCALYVFNGTDNVCEGCGFLQKDHPKPKGANRLTEKRSRIIVIKRIDRNDAPWLERDIEIGEEWWLCHRPFWMGLGHVPASQNQHSGVPVFQLLASHVHIEDDDLVAQDEPDF